MTDVFLHANFPAGATGEGGDPMRDADRPRAQSPMRDPDMDPDRPFEAQRHRQRLLAFLTFECAVDDRARAGPGPLKSPS